MFWDRFVLLCNKIGKSPNGVCADLGLSVATATRWKQGSVPRDTTLKKIADYFGVSVSYLLGVVDDPDPFALIDPTKKDPPMLEAFKEAFAVAEEEAELINLFRQVPKESRPMVLAAIKVAIEATRKDRQ